jgi:hypothetical protein
MHPRAYFSFSFSFSFDLFFSALGSPKYQERDAHSVLALAHSLVITVGGMSSLDAVWGVAGGLQFVLEQCIQRDETWKC